MLFQKQMLRGLNSVFVGAQMPATISSSTEPEGRNEESRNMAKTKNEILRRNFGYPKDDNTDAL